MVYDEVRAARLSKHSPAGHAMHHHSGKPTATEMPIEALSPCTSCISVSGRGPGSAAARHDGHRNVVAHFAPDLAAFWYLHKRSSDLLYFALAVGDEQGCVTGHCVFSEGGS